MKIQFLGATDTVTGSKYLIRYGESTVLVDCGLFQGYKQLRLRNWSPLPLAPAAIDAVILTHAHIDHSGYLPLLVRQGFKGKVFCTPATADLCRLLLPDAGHLQEEEAEYANRHSFSKHAPAQPLYTRGDAERCLKQLHPVPYGKHWQPAPGLNASLTPSGHMLGASFVQLDNGSRSILFSGDIGRPNDYLLHAPSQMDGADYLVVESTYGDRQHTDTDPLLELGQVINRTSARGGVVVIPAFAVGRAQTLLHCIRLLKDQGVIPQSLPIYLNSPMAAGATQSYLKHRAELRLSPGQCEAMADTARIVQSPEESRQLNKRHGPMVIISASGMATGGRVVHHLKAFAPDKRNTLLFAGFQAGGTRGATLVSGASTVRIHGEDVPVRAEVVQLDDLSAHADAVEILDWLRRFKSAPKQTFITHGEPAAADAMRQRIERELHWACHMPFYLETFDLV
ncbi:metallo-beta-lactamase family protein [Polaromonas sp. OV174]|uniref:MBL fold metallo-hydrolase RNA specificity domain-containing protein n=1 Tax=Polaromonas sp. OV174 TaxID=1855300 RepID=UPI0008F30BFA|nr:MBL fold metallo-hydrolase [Polaromonas sp. OV174]SFC25586.1 metallo-beta-lactamase family protein [Polaromonas sp. OV174]